MSPSLFGTDGVRGVVNKELTPRLVFDLVESAAGFFGRRAADLPVRGVVAVGRDTRRSGDMLLGSVVAAVTSSGFDVLDMGVVPTPAVAHAAAGNDEIIGGVVISASHNPADYNGIKFFDGDGFKLTPDDEAEIEGAMGSPGNRADPGDLGSTRRGDRYVWAYLQHLTTSLDLEPDSLAGLRVALDCSNGAGYRLGPAAFRSAGAEVTAIYDRPDGYNINVDCGSTRPEALIGMMTAGDYDVGFALDGDADRIAAVTPQGRVLDGDDILYIIARDMMDAGELSGEAVVATIINNLGLGTCLEPLGVQMVTCPVGDREIMMAMRERGATLGGEISGHIVLGHCATTGDGILSALIVARAQVKGDRDVEELVAGFEKYPQVVQNVPVRDRDGLAGDASIQEAISRVEEELGDDGRIIVRPSGTEPVVRILIEGPRREMIERMANRLADIVADRLG